MAVAVFACDAVTGCVSEIGRSVVTALATALVNALCATTVGVGECAGATVGTGVGDGTGVGALVTVGVGVGAGASPQQAVSSKSVANKLRI